MARRLNKRQQRELEELQALSGPAIKAQDAEESEEEVVARAPAPKLGFAALMGDQDEAQSESEGDEPKAKSKKSKKKKKKATSTEPSKPSTPIPAKSAPTVLGKNEKKALKKAKAKERKAADDELEQALKELSMNYPASQKMTQKTASGLGFADLLSVAPQHLDPDAEMRKFFGSKVVQANKAGSSSGGAAGSPARRKAATVRSTLTRPQPTWWAAKAREGLSIRPLTDPEFTVKLQVQGWQPLGDEKWWTVEYSKRYKSLTKVFLMTVASGDPQGFWDLLSKSPWHADTLLQLSEVYRHREEHAQAVDFVDRALFTYERAFVGAFNFTNGVNRLDFDRVENRPFFLALHRQVADLNRRGCVRTAFEFGKLLYSLDPWGDPHGSLLHLDFLAIKAGMHQWLVDLYDLFADREQEKKDARIYPSLLPGFTYAKALALRLLEGPNAQAKSTEALKAAMKDFPSVLPLLADKLDVALPASIRSHPDFRICTDANGVSPSEAAMHLFSHLYAQRSNAVWKDHGDWLASTATEVFANLTSARLPQTPRRKAFLTLYDNAGPRYAAYRHLVVLETDLKTLFPFIPGHIMQNSRSLSCDPMPPPNATTAYNDAFFQGVEDLASFRRTRTRRERAMDERRLAQMIPDGAFRQQLQAFFDGNENLQQRFHGGILQFAQAIAQLPPDVLEEIMMAEAMNGGGAMAEAMGAGGPPPEGGMPGGLDDMMDMGDDGEGMQVHPDLLPLHQGPPQVERGQASDHEEDDEGEEGSDGEDDEEEYISPMPRAVRNLLSRFWGRPAAPAEESSSEEDEEEEQRDLLDNNGVD